VEKLSDAPQAFQVVKEAGHGLVVFVYEDDDFPGPIFSMKLMRIFAILIV
jgi:hypothetical protein